MLKIYEKLLNIDKRYLTGREIARLLNIKDKSRRVMLSRYARRKILRRVKRDLYEIVIRPSDILEVANTIYQPSYLSFTYCLGNLGIIDQIPYEIEYATPKKTKRLEIRERSVVYRQIKKRLFFGYILKDKVFVAEPEKALLDTLYMESRGLMELNRTGLNLKGLSRKKILNMSQPFPEKVKKAVAKIAKNMK